MNASEQSTAQIATVVAPTRPRLWHAAANAEERVKAGAGEPFRTRCGLTSGRSSGPRPSRKAWQLAPMEPCVVCRLSGKQADQ